jgi:hypothetical protein
MTSIMDAAAPAPRMVPGVPPVQKDKELSKFYGFLAKPLFFRARFLLALLVVPLVLAFSQPLWRIQLQTPQYPAGLTLEIYAHTIEGGHGGADIREINILNHYVGMRTLERQDLTDLDWIPFALGLLAILALRCAVVGEVRSLIDLVVTTLYVSTFATVRFLLKLRSYGNDLNPDAPLKVPPFTPTMFGSTTVGDVTTFASPGAGTYLIAVFALGILAVLIFHLVVGRKREVTP